MPLVRRWLGSFLLVLYVAALHGLPALHLVRHQNDHVHELGGLRWLRPVSGHVHGAGQRHESQDTEVVAPRSGPRQHLRAVTDTHVATAAPHLASGPAHGHSALLAPLFLVALAPTAQSHRIDSGSLVLSASELVSHHRARAPPLLG